MKTQLLQDLNDSGSANAGPPTPEPKGPPATTRQRDATVRPEVPAAEAATPSKTADTPAVRPAEARIDAQAEAPAAAPASASAAVHAGPAVWQRPRQQRADMPAATAEPAAPVHPHLTIQPKGFAPQPLPFGAPVPDRDAPYTADRDPDWLAERLARDAALHERPEWSGPWTRRLAVWGAAGVLLALVAAGGLWLYDQRQVEGALVVVANTNPAPAAELTRPVVPRDLPAPAAQNVPAPAVGTAPTTDAVGQSARSSTAAAAGDPMSDPTVEAPSVKAVDTAADARRADTASSSRGKTRTERSARVAGEQADATPPKRRHAATRKQTKTLASAAGRDDARAGERSYRQRYEETLMQCRAHGYDERQCLQRGCEMTRFGFACKG